MIGGMRWWHVLWLAIAFGCDGSHGDFCEGACVCEQQSVCIGECGDGCVLGCRDVSDCDAICDHACTMICERVFSVGDR